MCVIVYKPAASKMPSLDDLRKCFEANPDGAGLMWPGDDGYVHIRKGLMTWDAFESAVLSRDFAGKPVVFHFRISTQGGIQPGLTHPFPVCGSYEAMRSLCVKSRMGLAHNGIIGLTSDGSKDHNDTMRFVKDFAEALKSKESRRIVDSGVADESGECMLDGNEYSSMKRGTECYLLEKSPNSAIIVEDGPGRTMTIFINRAQFLKEIA